MINSVYHGASLMWVGRSLQVSKVHEADEAVQSWWDIRDVYVPTKETYSFLACILVTQWLNKGMIQQNLWQSVMYLCHLMLSQYEHSEMHDQLLAPPHCTTVWSLQAMVRPFGSTKIQLLIEDHRSMRCRIIHPPFQTVGFTGLLFFTFGFQYSDALMDRCPSTFPASGQVIFSNCPDYPDLESGSNCDQLMECFSDCVFFVPDVSGCNGRSLISISGHTTETQRQGVRYVEIILSSLVLGKCADLGFFPFESQERKV